MPSWGEDRRGLEVPPEHHRRNPPPSYPVSGHGISGSGLSGLSMRCGALLTGIGGGADGLSYHGYKEIMEQYDLKERDLEEVISDLESGMKKVEGMLNLLIPQAE